MSDSFPAPVYAETVLTHNFADAQKYFLGSLLEIHYAHTRMLAGCGILTGEEERKLLASLDGLDRPRILAADQWNWLVQPSVSCFRDIVFSRSATL